MNLHELLRACGWKLRTIQEEDFWQHPKYPLQNWSTSAAMHQSLDWSVTELAETRAQLERQSGAADGYLERLNVSEEALANERTLSQKLGFKLNVIEHLAHQACVVWESTKNHSLHDIRECMKALRQALDAGERVFGMGCTPAERAVLDAWADVPLATLKCWAKQGPIAAAKAELARRGEKP